MKLPYYKLTGKDGDKEFLYSHSGWFDICDKGLILRDVEHCIDSGYVLINRDDPIPSDYKIYLGDKFFTFFPQQLECNKFYLIHIINAFVNHEPKEMFEDFPELIDVYY